MRDEFNKIVEILGKCKWTQSSNPPSEENPDSCSFDDYMTSFVKEYDTGIVVIDVALEPSSLGHFGYYGVCSVQVLKFYNSPPYNRDDLREMKELLEEAEYDLLSHNIPFRPDYCFLDGRDSSIGKNLKCRAEYGLHIYERRD